MDCRHFGACGGCSVPGVPYAEQLERKRSRLAALLGMDVPPIVPSPAESHFRQKAAFVFGSPARGRGLVLGHYAAGSKRITAVDECPVHSRRANRVAFALRDRLSRAGIGAADRPGGILRHVIVRTTEDEREAVAMLVVTRNDRSLRAPVRGLLASADRPDSFVLNVHDRPGPYMVGDESIAIDGPGHVLERGLGLSFIVSPTAFFQTNVGAARELVRLVVAAVADAARVLDLYCGSGLFALPLAAAGASVTAIEENRQAIADLKTNVRLNRIPSGRLRPVAARVEEALDRAAGQPWDAVVLDPPRDGCAAGVLDDVFRRIAPNVAVYVSCNPEALSRDLPAIRDAGYAIDTLQALDMFPHTEHIETVVRFRNTQHDRLREGGKREDTKCSSAVEKPA
jgi:23S rRNA (uracil1939-C5)-methyltransferase